MIEMEPLKLRDIHFVHAQFLTRSPTCPQCYQPRTECGGHQR